MKKQSNILLCSVGFALPVIFSGKFKRAFFFLQSFASGVVIAIAIIHIFPGLLDQFGLVSIHSFFLSHFKLIYISEAIETLGNPCLGFSDFPWAPMIMVFALLATFSAENIIHSVLWHTIHGKPNVSSVDGMWKLLPSEIIIKQINDEIVHTPLILDEAEKGTGVEENEEITLRSKRVAAYFLEAGIIFHSIFIGLLFGTSKDNSLVKSLAFALSFHQVL